MGEGSTGDTGGKEVRELRDIIENYSVPSEEELRYLQRKIANAGEMKTAIKRFLDVWPLAESDAKADRDAVKKRVRELKKAMEAYLNTI